MSRQVPDYLYEYPVVEGFPRPDWERICYWIEDNCLDQKSRHETHDDIVAHWLELVSEVPKVTHYVYETKDLMFLTPLGQEETCQIVQFTESVFEYLRSEYREVPDTIGYGCHIVLHFESKYDFEKYISYYIDLIEYKSSGWICTTGCEIWQIVLEPNDIVSLLRVLAHRLAYEYILLLQLPIWLGHGLALMAQRHFYPEMDQENLENTSINLKYFKNHSIQKFWNGAGFISDQDSRDACNELALLLARKIKTTFCNAQEYFLYPEHFDFGQFAARQFFMKSLGEIVSEILGPGDWEPEDYIEEKTY